MANVFSSSAQIKKEFKVIQVFSCTYQENMRERGKVESRFSKDREKTLTFVSPVSATVNIVHTEQLLPETLVFLCFSFSVPQSSAPSDTCQCSTSLCWMNMLFLCLPIFFFFNSFLLPAVICPANWIRRRLHMLTYINNFCLCCIWTQVSNYYAKLLWIYQLE